QRLAHGTWPWNQREEPDVLFEAYSEGALTVGLPVRHNAPAPVAPQRQTLVKGPWGLWAVARIAIAPAEAEREPLTTHTETAQPLLEIITPILAVPIRRTRRYELLGRGLALGRWARVFLISSIQSERRRILREPGGRDGIPL